MQQPPRAPRAQIHLRDRYNVKGAEAGLPTLPLLTQRSVRMRTTHPQPPGEGNRVLPSKRLILSGLCTFHRRQRQLSRSEGRHMIPWDAGENQSHGFLCTLSPCSPSSQILCTLGVNFASSPTCGLWLSPQRGLEEKNRVRNKISIIQEGAASWVH